MGSFSGLGAVAIVSTLAAISPGPDFVMVVKNSLGYSRRVGILTTLGICMALPIHLAYTLLGIGMLISEGSLVYLLLKYLGASYLFYIGCKSFISSFKKQEEMNFRFAGNVPSISATTALKQGFLTNLLNPKCALFFVSLFSQFIDASTPLSLKIGYAFVNWSITLVWFCFLSYMITGHYLLSRIGRFRMYIDRVMGCALMLLSLKLLI